MEDFGALLLRPLIGTWAGITRWVRLSLVKVVLIELEMTWNERRNQVTIWISARRWRAATTRTVRRTTTRWWSATSRAAATSRWAKRSAARCASWPASSSRGAASRGRRRPAASACGGPTTTATAASTRTCPPSKSSATRSNSSAKKVTGRSLHLGSIQVDPSETGPTFFVLLGGWQVVRRPTWSCVRTTAGPTWCTTTVTRTRAWAGRSTSSTGSAAWTRPADRVSARFRPRRSSRRRHPFRPLRRRSSSCLSLLRFSSLSVRRAPVNKDTVWRVRRPVPFIARRHPMGEDECSLELALINSANVVF